MNDDRNRIDKLFPLPNPQAAPIPIVGQAEQPVVFVMQIALTPKLRDRLTKWMEKVGLAMNELAGEIARQGIMELSRKIDDPKDRINHPETFFPEKNGSDQASE